MKIGELSKATGTNIETIRYYERIGLLPEPARTAGNYRSYGEAHRTRLAFVRHSRELGFAIEEVRSLLDLADHPERKCSEADRIAARRSPERLGRGVEQLRDGAGRGSGPPPCAHAAGRPASGLADALAARPARDR